MPAPKMNDRLSSIRTPNDLKNFSTDELYELRDNCTDLMQSSEESDDHSDWMRASDKHRMINAAIDQREGRGPRMSPDVLNALRNGDLDHRSAGRPTAPQDHRVRLVEAAGRRMPVNYTDDRHWRYDDDGPEPAEFRGWSEADCFRAFAEDFHKLARGERPRNSVVQSDTVSLGIDSYTEPRIWRYIFERSVLGRAGIGTMQMPAPSHRILVVKDPMFSRTASWVAEGEKIPVVSSGLTGVEMHAHKCGMILPMSRELLEDAPNVSTAFEDHLVSSMADGIDFDMLTGAGLDGGPVGLFRKALQAGAGGSGNVFAEIVNLAYQFAGADYPGKMSDLRLIWNPRLAEHAELTTDNEGRYLEPPQTYRDIQKIATTKTPIYSQDDGQGGTETGGDALMLDPGSVILGQRRGIRIERSDSASYTHPKTGVTRNMFERDEVAWKITFRGDIAVVRSAFVRKISMIKLPE